MEQQSNSAQKPSQQHQPPQQEYERGILPLNHSSKTPDRMKRDEWSEGAVATLLDAYEAKWVLRNRAKLKGNDWEEVARHVCGRNGGARAMKTQSQCKNKIEALKKRYRSEATSGGGQGTWGFFGRMEVLLRCSAGTSGGGSKRGETEVGAIPCQNQNLHRHSQQAQTQTQTQTPIPIHNYIQNLNHHSQQHQEQEKIQNRHSQQHHRQQQQVQQHQQQPQDQPQDLPESQAEEDASNTLPQPQIVKRKEELSPDSITSTPRSKIAHAMEGSGKTLAAAAATAAAGSPAAAGALGKRRKNSSSSEIADTIRSLADSILKLEQAKMEMFRDSERLRAEAEARRVDMELKRTEIIAKTQLQIAKLLSRKPLKRKVTRNTALQSSNRNGNTASKPPPPCSNGTVAARCLIDG